jgi:hypothetical protein
MMSEFNLSDILTPSRRQNRYQTDAGSMEPLYQAWLRQNNINDTPDYDMRGFYMGMLTGAPQAQSAIDPHDGRLHFSDWWKTPEHESFSEESRYAPQGSPRWRTMMANLLDDKNGRNVYAYPSIKDLFLSPGE